MALWILKCELSVSFSTYVNESDGAIAQLGERYNGIVEVGGSIPPSSTTLVVVQDLFL